MKTTYLVYKQVNGVRQLVVATPAEWDAILKENRDCTPSGVGTLYKTVLRLGMNWIVCISK